MFSWTFSCNFVPLCSSFVPAYIYTRAGKRLPLVSFRVITRSGQLVGRRSKWSNDERPKTDFRYSRLCAEVTDRKDTKTNFSNVGFFSFGLKIKFLPRYLSFGLINLIEANFFHLFISRKNIADIFHQKKRLTFCKSVHKVKQ